MCIPLPPAPEGTVVTPTTPPAPAPLPPAATPGLPPTASVAAITLDTSNSRVQNLSGGGTPATFQEVIGDNGILITSTSGSGGYCTLSIVLQNMGDTPSDATIAITPLISGLSTITPASPFTVNVPANNYVTAEFTYSTTSDGTIPVAISIGTTTVTLNIAFQNLSP